VLTRLDTIRKVQDPVVGRFDPDQKDLETGLLRLVKDPRMLRYVNPGMDTKDLFDLVLDNQVAKLFAPLRVGEEVVVAEEHHIGRHRLQFLDHRFDRSFRVTPFLAERIEAEGAELAFERASPRGQDGVEGVTAQSKAVFHQAVRVSSQGPVRKGNATEVRQGMNFVVDDAPVLPVRKPTDILARHPCDDLLNDLFALTPHDHVDIRATAKQGLDFLRRFMTSDNCSHLRRQLRHEITDLVESGIPRDAYTKEIDLVPDKLVECLRVLVGLLIPKVKQRHFVDEVFHACGDVLQASWREKSLDRPGRIPEIRVQGENVLVLDHVGIFSGQ